MFIRTFKTFYYKSAYRQLEDFKHKHNITVIRETFINGLLMIWYKENE